MTVVHGVLALFSDSTLRNDVDRVAAAAGVEVVHTREPSTRTVWTAAAAVLLDVAAARRCAELALPRRDRVVLVDFGAPGADAWQAAITVGACDVIALPDGEAELVTVLSDATAAARESAGRGTVVTVIAGRGGAGASLFATALAYAAPDALLVDVDPWGGGIDLALGGEAEVGLRWPDLSLQDGRLQLSALRAALPRHRGISVLSNDRTSAEIEAGPLTAVLDAGRRGGATVICDTPRRSTAAAETALAAADLVVLLLTADVRSCSAAAAIRSWIAAVNPNVGLVVRGPAPGGLRGAEIARSLELPLLASMRPQPGLAEALERDGLRVRRRSPMMKAARRVLTVLQRHQAVDAA